MSDDVIDFTLTTNHRERAATVCAAARAFGVTAEQANQWILAGNYTGTRIRCRPDQFGRFIALRIEEGVICNRVRELKPKLIKLAPKPATMDVTGN